MFYNCRENNDLITAVKSNHVQALIMPKFKNQRENLLTFKYNNCDSIYINSEGIAIIFYILMLSCNFKISFIISQCQKKLKWMIWN